MTPGETMRNFDRKYGEGSAIVVGGYVYYPDGSYREVNPAGFYAHAEDLPPLKVADNKVRYHVEALKRAKAMFDEMKLRLKFQAKAAQKGPLSAPSEEDLDKLKELRGAVRQAQKGAEAARAEWNELKPGPVIHDSTVADEVLRQLNRIEV